MSVLLRGDIEARMKASEDSVMIMAGSIATAFPARTGKP